MPSEWRETTVGDFCPFAYGEGLPEGRRKPGSVPVFGSNGIVGLHDRTLTSGPTIVIGRKGTVGAVHYSPQPCWPIDTTFYVAAGPGRDIRFAYYLLKSLGLDKMNSDSAVPGLNRDAAHAREMRVPDVPVQRAIARILGALDDKIELNRKMNETLEQMARAMFKSWFVDFEPFRDKGMVDSPLGRIPKGWRVGRVDEDFNLTMGQSPPGETYNESGGGVPFYQGRTDFGFRFPTVRVYCTAPTRMAKAGDTLVSVRAPVGSVNMASGECAVGRGVAAVRHKSGSRSYTYYFMRSLEPEFARYEAEGTVFGSINKDDFHAIERAAPPAAVVDAFERTLYPFDQRIGSDEAESRTLAAIRDTLLPKLMSGEVRAETFVRETGGS
jgi:type I restriction enzyme S subunit